jgi:glycosyltransferase involved in cell wall biosynthesis
MTRVAVIVPVHNDGDLAREAVESVRAQEPVELVIVDDGSTDPGTRAALDALEADGVRVVRQPNGGPGAARMAGVRATSAPYILPLDSDDLLEDGAVAALADVLDANPEAGFAWGDYTLFGEYEGRYRTPTQFLPWSLTWVNVYPITALLRRTAVDRAGGWIDGGYEDWGLYLRFVELGIPGVDSGRLVYRRRLHGSHRAAHEYRRRHRELYAGLKRRHASAFASRRALARVERPPLWKRAVYPVLFGPRRVVPYPVEAWLQRTMMRRGLRLSR